MQLRNLGGDASKVSEVGLGCWQFGGDAWGDVPEADAIATLHAAADAGTTFLDTADVYGLGRSEELIGKFLKERKGPFFVATKLGRFPKPGGEANYTPTAMRQHTEASLKRLGVDSLDLTQLHCVPPKELERGDVFETLRQLKKEGIIKRFGASVESAAEAVACLRQDGLASLQVIFSIFRQTPIDAFFDEANRKGVAIIVRLPLASGLLSGKYGRDTKFAANDHRSFNANGEHFNVGETFAGLGLAKGAELAEKLRPLVPAGLTMTQFALRWCLDFPAVSTIIPGARNAEQAKNNAAVSELPSLPAALHEKLRHFFQTQVKPNVRGPD